MEERIEKHIHQYVEAELRNYRTYKKLIGEYDKELLYRGAKSGLGKDPTGRFSQNRISDPTYDEVAGVIANEQRVRRMKDVVMCIEDVLEELSEEEARLVEMKYFKSCYTDFGIIGELHIGQTKYYGDKKRIIRKFALRMRLI
ncbi:transcriptional regulator [Desulfitobacterium hafniense]|uniref:Transcriptional regulator n=3 Tax=root TaxID=1 RepID=A0A0W1JD15_DESHA|nr:transcriptional regulator [Desulfitobacterium hafniense]ACL19465.1 phage transcriptional regulator, RinA family [Desulfitobacterium hafniense DCB-2]KTE89282.1 transcriptional regulator [Desulfitobacterium hafniense]MEA5023581.1 transcriptional regulator [Desulfitobacterium hafniense]